MQAARPLNLPTCVYVAQLQELRDRCKELQQLLLERQQELRGCAAATVQLGAEAAAAKGAQLSKAWELQEAEKRMERQLSVQVEERLHIEADKHQCEVGSSQLASL